MTLVEFYIYRLTLNLLGAESGIINTVICQSALVIYLPISPIQQDTKLPTLCGRGNAFRAPFAGIPKDVRGARIMRFSKVAWVTIAAATVYPQSPFIVSYLKLHIICFELA